VKAATAVLSDLGQSTAGALMTAAVLLFGIVGGVTVALENPDQQAAWLGFCGMLFTSGVTLATVKFKGRGESNEDG